MQFNTSVYKTTVIFVLLIIFVLTRSFPFQFPFLKISSLSRTVSEKSNRKYKDGLIVSADSDSKQWPRGTVIPASRRINACACRRMHDKPVGMVGCIDRACRHCPKPRPTKRRNVII